MLPRVSHAQVVGPYVLLLTFTDGSSGTVDLRNDIVDRGGVFRELEQPKNFAEVIVDPDAGTIRWPNGVDFDPDVLYCRATPQPPVTEGLGTRIARRFEGLGLDREITEIRGQFVKPPRFD
jgi:hypothetical protein